MIWNIKIDSLSEIFYSHGYTSSWVILCPGFEQIQHEGASRRPVL